MNADNFFKPRLSKFNHFPIKCPYCYLRMNVVISYDKENDCYNPKSTECKVCLNPIPISINPCVVKK